MPAEEVFDAVAYQLGIFQAIASALKVQPNHVKPHGALYNMAVRDANLADAIARAVESIDAKLLLFAPDKSELARAGEAHGLQIGREIFADRNYLNDGWLVPRTRPDALLHDPKEAAERVLRMLREGKVRSIEGQDVEVRGETVCVHGDTPGAVGFARELRTRLEREGVRISAPESSRSERQQDRKWEPAPAGAAERQALCGPRAAAVSNRHDQSRPRTWADRRDHDCHRLNDRVWDLHRVSGVIAIEWRAGLAVTRMGARRLADDYRRAVLLGVGDDDAASRRCLCFSARSVRFSHRIFVWLDVVSRGPNGDDRSGSDCVREVSRRFCHISFTR